MFLKFNEFRKDERGQTLVVGAISFFVVAIMILSTVAIGKGVYEKMKLQDAADAQAYTTAVKEARAYNFFAYVNRGQVVHYCAMLTFLSYLSHAYYLKNTIGRAASVLKAVPYIGVIFAIVERIIDAWMQIVDVLVQVLTPILSALNVALWLAQEAMLFATFGDLLLVGNSPSVVGTDPKAQPGYAMNGVGMVGNLALNFINSRNFLKVVDDTDGADIFGITTRAKLFNRNNLSDPTMFKYRELMGNVANASRREWTAVGKGPILIGRRWDLSICVGIGEINIDKTAMSEIKSFSERFDNNIKDQLFASEDINIEVCAICWKPCKTILEYRIRVAADYRNGYHAEGLSMWTAKTAKHHFWVGITPFMAASPTFSKPQQNKFDEPSNMVVLTKDMMSQRKVWELKTQHFFKDQQEAGYGYQDAALQKGGVTAGAMDMTWNYVGGNNSIGNAFRQHSKGMMVLSNARAVYHRPGVWQEQPNFFNPVWTARLAPLETNPMGDVTLALVVPEYGILKQLNVPGTQIGGRYLFNY